MRDVGGADSVRSGQAGEKSAEYFCTHTLGFKVIARNFRSRVGELDLVAEDRPNRTLVFIEVKAYRQKSFKSGEAAITRNKAYRLTQTAQFFLLRHPQYSRYFMRFDLMVVENGQVARHLKNINLNP